MKKEIIEVPFGAKDSELLGFEYTIPEGMEAEIRDGKVIVKKKESKDERIRKEIINFLSNELHNVKQLTPRTNEFEAWIAYLERQKEQNMIQWTGKNLMEVVNFTRLNPRFYEYFKNWEEYEEYVHSHNNIFKIFNLDGSHYEVPVGAWIVRTPDRYCIASRSTFVPCKNDKPKEKISPIRDAWYVCIKDFYGGGKKQCSAGDLVQAKGGMYMMSREDLSEWFRFAYFHEIFEKYETYFRNGWTKDDEDYYDTIVGKLQIIGEDSGLTRNQIDFLNLHRPNGFNWKPSKSEMNALNVASTYEPVLSNREELKNLYNKLKILM